MAVLSDGTIKTMDKINNLLSSYNISEIEFISDKQKTRDQIIELAKKTSVYLLENTGGMVYEEKEKLLYSIIDALKKILGPQLVMDIFKDPINSTQEKRDPIKQTNNQTLNKNISTNQQEDVPDVSEIPGLEDLLNGKK